MGREFAWLLFSTKIDCHGEMWTEINCTRINRVGVVATTNFNHIMNVNICGAMYKRGRGSAIPLRCYARVGSKSVEEAARGATRKALPLPPLNQKQQQAQGEDGQKRQGLPLHRFNLFENVGQREEANFSNLIPSDGPTKTFPFNSRHVEEILGISRLLLKEDNKLLPVMILMGPSHPVSQSKLPYISFTQQLAKEMDAQMVDLPLDKLRKLALFTNPQNAQFPEDSVPSIRQ